jgi:hypothetical protein
MYVRGQVALSMFASKQLTTTNLPGLPFGYENGFFKTLWLFSDRWKIKRLGSVHTVKRLMFQCRLFQCTSGHITRDVNAIFAESAFLGPGSCKVTFVLTQVKYTILFSFTFHLLFIYFLHTFHYISYIFHYLVYFWYTFGILLRYSFGILLVYF